MRALRAILKPATTPMILRNLRQVKIDKFGYPTINSQDGSRDMRFFVPVPNLLVYEFELYFATSYRLYAIEYVRAPDMRTAKRKIKHQYSKIIKFKWDDLHT